MNFELIVYRGKTEESRHNAPTEENARVVARWHLKTGHGNVVVIRNIQTGFTEELRSDDDNIFNVATGELVAECPGCRESAVVIAGLERDIKAGKRREAALTLEVEDEMKRTPEFEEVEILFEFWKRICKHPKSVLDIARYKNVISFLKKEGIEMCARAIAGAAFDSFSQQNRAGRKISYNDWEFIFRNRTNFEKECNRAPGNWKELYQWESGVLV